MNYLMSCLSYYLMSLPDVLMKLKMTVTMLSPYLDNVLLGIIIFIKVRQIAMKNREFGIFLNLIRRQKLKRKRVTPIQQGSFEALISIKHPLLIQFFFGTSKSDIKIDLPITVQQLRNDPFLDSSYNLNHSLGCFAIRVPKALMEV